MTNWEIKITGGTPYPDPLPVSGRIFVKRDTVHWRSMDHEYRVVFPEGWPFVGKKTDIAVPANGDSVTYKVKKVLLMKFEYPYDIRDGKDIKVKADARVIIKP